MTSAWLSCLKGTSSGRNRHASKTDKEWCVETLSRAILKYLISSQEKLSKYRIVNAAISMNKVTIKNANLPPNVEGFSEEFAGMVHDFLIDPGEIVLAVDASL